MARAETFLNEPRDGSTAADIDDLSTPGSGLIYVHIVEEHEGFRRFLHELLSVKSNLALRHFRSRDDFLAQRDDLEPGCVLLTSCDRSEGPSSSLVRTIADDPRFASIVLSRVEDVSAVVRIMKAGAADYLLGPWPTEKLWLAICEAADQVRQVMLLEAGMVDARERMARLSAREHDVLAGLIEGKSNKMIAQELELSPRTVEIYRAHLMGKLGVHSLSEVLRLAYSAGIDPLVAPSRAAI